MNVQKRVERQRVEPCLLKPAVIMERKVIVNELLDRARKKDNAQNR